MLVVSVGQFSCSQGLTPVSGRLCFPLQHRWVPEFLLRSAVPACHTGIPPLSSAQTHTEGSNESQSLWCCCSHCNWALVNVADAYLHSAIQENMSCKFAICLHEWQSLSVDRKSSENHTQLQKNSRKNMLNLPAHVLFAWLWQTWLFSNPPAP